MLICKLRRFDHCNLLLIEYIDPTCFLFNRYSCERMMTIDFEGTRLKGNAAIYSFSTYGFKNTPLDFFYISTNTNEVKFTFTMNNLILKCSEKVFSFDEQLDLLVEIMNAKIERIFKINRKTFSVVREDQLCYMLLD